MVLTSADFRFRIDLESYLECHLRREYELVALEKTSGRVHEYEIGNTIDQVVHSQCNVVGRYGFFDRVIKHHAESL